MPEKIEEILKTLHLFLSSCDRFADYEDLLIVSKKEIFQILEKLNLAIYDSMDEMKMTKHQKEQEELEAQRAADELLEKAAYNAEEVYAASLLYTDGALNKLKEIIEKNHEIIQEEYQGMVKQMEERMSAIDYNQSELRKQLMDMYQNDFYIKMMNAEKEKYLASHPVYEQEEEQPKKEVPEIRINEAHLRAVQEERGVSWFREENERIKAEENLKMFQKQPFLEEVMEEMPESEEQDKKPAILVNEKHLQQVIKEREAYERKRQKKEENFFDQTKSSVKNKKRASDKGSGNTKKMPDAAPREKRESLKGTNRQEKIILPEEMPTEKKDESAYVEMEMEEIQESLKETIQNLANLDFNFDLSKQIEHETELAIAQDEMKRDPDLVIAEPLKDVYRGMPEKMPKEENTESRWNGYGKAAAFSNEELDAEYERWKAGFEDHDGSEN